MYNVISEIKITLFNESYIYYFHKICENLHRRNTYNEGIKIYHSSLRNREKIYQVSLNIYYLTFCVQPLKRSFTK